MQQVRDDAGTQDDAMLRSTWRALLVLMVAGIGLLLLQASGAAPLA